MRKMKKITKRVQLLALCAAAGAIFMKAEVLRFPAPIAALLPAVLSPIYGAAALAGAAFGGLLMFSADALPIIAAAAAAMISRVRFRGLERKRASFTVSALTAGTYLMCAAVVGVFSGETVLELLRLLIYSALMMALTYTFSEMSAKLRSAAGVTKGELLLACAAAICALSSVEILGVSLGAAAAAYLVMLVSTRFGACDAVTAAVIFALSAGICSPRLFSEFALLSIPALLCGRFAFASPIKSATIHLLIITPIAVLFGGDMSLMLLPASCAAAVILVISYSRASKLAEGLIYSDIPKPRPESTAALSYAVSNISKKLRDFHSNPTVFSTPLSDAVYAKVCLSCPKNGECFDESCGRSTLSELDKLKTPELTEICRALPYCTKIAEVRAVSVLARRRTDYLAEKMSANRSSVRECSRMLAAVDKAVKDAEKTALRAASADEFLTARLAGKLRAAGVKFISCSAFAFGGAEIRLAASVRVNEARLAALVSEALGESCAPPENIGLGDSILLKFARAPEYSVNAGYCQLSADKDFSGDVAETFTAGGHSYTVLSDGMGIGSQARAAATTLVNLIKEQLCAGFSVEAAVSLSSLILGAALPEESFATLDILRVNLRTGAAEIYKAGGCRSYIFADGSENVLREGGYPIGILDDCDIRTHRFFVRESAAVVMYTDGAAALTPSDCSRTVNGGLFAPPAELASHILQASHPEKSPQKDDVSVAVVKIERVML